MHCPQCGTYHAGDAAFCIRCGTRLGTLTCPSCHHQNSSAAHFCQACGQKLQATPVEQSRVQPPDVFPQELPFERSVVQQPTRPPIAPPVQEYKELGAVRYAGFWARLAAYLIDQVLLLIVFGIVGSLFSLLVYRSMADPNFYSFFPIQTPDLPPDEQITQRTVTMITSAFETYTFYAIYRWVYYAVMEASSLQATVGKLLLGLKVTDIRGRRLTFGRAIGRTFAKYVSNMTLYIGYMMAGWTKRKQALHDLMAECLVVRKD